MGNCCRCESSMVWADDDDEEWVNTVAPGSSAAEKQTLLDQRAKNSSSSSPSRREVVKIKISKKQLEEILGGAEVHDIPMDQVLNHLIDASDHFEVHQRSWSPNLQSIPEDAY